MKTDSQTGDRVWSTVATDMQSGAALGKAGVAYAFVRTYKALRRSPLDANKRFLNAALEAFEHDQIHAEEESIDHAEKNASWGSGAAGRGLMLLPFLDIADVPEVQEKKIEAVIESYAGDVLERTYCGSDTLGCGRMGRVEFLLSAGLKLGRSEWVSAARRALIPRCKSEETEMGFITDWDPGNCDPGLFHGAAGIGYELLRASHPEQVPSLLLFES
jgi:lantibiotic modifying enzyme